MGTFTSETDYPLDSAIYWIGSGICTFWILEGHMKKSKKKGGPKEKRVVITKRDKWVEYLHRKQFQTNTTFLNTTDKTNMVSVQHSQGEIKELIATLITNPNISWTKQKNSIQDTAFPEITLANTHEYCMNRYVDAPISINSPTYFCQKYLYQNILFSFSSDDFFLQKKLQFRR